MTTDIIRFGNFELDRVAYQLRNNGVVVPLERVPLDLLFLLVEKPGQLLTRDEIYQRIWGKKVFVDAESAINTAIRKVRRALDEQALKPQFVIRVPGKGYRFDGPICVANHERTLSSTTVVGRGEARVAEGLDAPLTQSQIEHFGRPSAAALKKPDEPQIRPADTSAPENFEGERKTVTALLADFKGSMGLAEDLDPEKARAIVDPALKLMIDAVHHYDGYVTRCTDDGISALFGAPLAHEDHPQRALYAALRMQEDLERYSDGIRVKGRLPIRAGVGVNTGEVVVRSIPIGEGRAEYAPVGHSIGIAARMQALAPVGSIAATEPVRKLCEGYFLFRSLRPTKVKGVSEPVAVYEVTGLGPLRTRLQRSAARGYTRFVGREREMEALCHAAEQARSGRGQIVAVVAEPGVGKSRLFDEFRTRIPAECKLLESYSLSHGKSSAWLPVLELLHGYFGITETDDAASRRDKFRAALTALDPALEDTLPYLFGLLRIVDGADPHAQMDARIKRQRTLDAIKRIILRDSLRQPVVIMFEDLHWIDEQTQGLLDLLADSVASARMLLLFNYRPEYHHGWANKSYYSQLRLEPLAGTDGAAMLTALLGEGDKLSPIKRLIAERTGGNPFFIEEVVQGLFEDGALVRNGTVRITRSLSQLRLPPTVQGVLAARVDRLPRPQKDLLQTLAVIGREAQLRLVRKVTSADEVLLSQNLAELCAGEFIQEQPVAGDTEFVFKHALTREVAYNSLLANRRRTTHEQIGCAIETLFESQLEDHYSELAHHYLCSSNAAKAVHYTLLAAEQAVSRAAYTEATSMVGGALPLLNQLANETARLDAEFALRGIENAVAFALYGGASPQREHAIRRMCEVGEGIGGQKQAESLITLTSFYFQRGEVRQGMELAHRCLSLTDATCDPSLLADAHVTTALLAFLAGKLPECVSHLEDCLRNDRIAHASPSSRIFLSPVGLPYELRRGISLCSALQLLGRVGEATNFIEQTLRAARESNNVHGLAFVLTFMADPIRWYRREPELALVEAEEAIAISEENGFTDRLHRGRFARGWARTELGQPEQGIAEMERGIVAFGKMGGGLAQQFATALLAYAYATKGRREEGLAMLNDALEESKRTGVQVHQAEMLRLKGEVLLMQEGTATAKAERCFRAAIEIARAQEAKWWELRTTVSLARILRDTDRHDEARAILATIYNWFTEGFHLLDLNDAKTLLDELSNSP